MIKRLAMWSLFAVLLLPQAAFAQAGAKPLVPGVDYAPIDGGQPYEPLNGKIEVVEIFGYWCHFCAAFQPMVETWSRKLPADVRFSPVPAVYELDDAFARAFFAAQSKGLLARSHDAVFEAVHTDNVLPKNASADEIASFYEQYGVKAGDFVAAMQAPAVDARMKHAREFALGTGLEGTPTLIVNGRYRVLGKSYEDMLRIADGLIAQERAARR